MPRPRRSRRHPQNRLSSYRARSHISGARSSSRSERATSPKRSRSSSGWSTKAERKMAGDMLFRAALEDMGEGGRKLFLSVKSWQLARSLGFKGARTILRPAVDYLVKGPRDRTAYETILAVLGKEWVDLEALSSGGRPLDEPGRKRMHLIASAPTDAACIDATLALLRDGYAASA